MIILRDTELLKGKKPVATVGFFDGVHLGHRFLIQKMKEKAQELGLPTCVITFPQHPRKVLHSEYQPKLLNSFSEKLIHLEETGIDYCLVLDFTPQLSELSAETFICSFLAVECNVHTLFVGYDHRFGHNRAEGINEYMEYGKKCGIEIIQSGSYTEAELSISSSEIRRLLSDGKMEEAAHLLTYPYQIKGHIVDGYKMGRKLGFPTANIQVDEPYKVIPAIGVYAVTVNVNEQTYLGMLYIGSRPTLNNGENITLEVNIFNFSEDIYNKEITVAFIHYIRGDIRFENLDALKEQLNKDRIAVEKSFNENI